MHTCNSVTTSWKLGTFTVSQFITSIKAYQVKKTTTYSLQCNGKFQPSFSLSQRAVFKEATCSELPSELLFQVEELHRIHETCIDQGFVCINDTLEKKKQIHFKPIFYILVSKTCSTLYKVLPALSKDTQETED